MVCLNAMRQRIGFERLYDIEPHSVYNRIAVALFGHALRGHFTADFL